MALTSLQLACLLACSLMGVMPKQQYALGEGLVLRELAKKDENNRTNSYSNISSLLVLRADLLALTEVVRDAAVVMSTKTVVSFESDAGNTAAVSCTEATNTATTRGLSALTPAQLVSLLLCPASRVAEWSTAPISIL
jgi:hypothetical protein